jgi:hypothetical protein
MCLILETFISLLKVIEQKWKVSFSCDHSEERPNEFEKNYQMNFWFRDIPVQSILQAACLSFLSVLFV